jgi:hypothetical protein
MTAFGKLLIFMNLIFSVVTGALIVFVFTTRANWVSAYNDAKQKVELAEKAYKAEAASHQNDLKQKDATLKGMEDQLKALTTQHNSALAEAETSRKLASDQEKNNLAANTAQQKLQTELNQIKAEREAIIKEKEQLRQMIVKIQDELGKQREIAVLADLNSKNLIQKNNNLLRQLENLTARVRELESSGLVGTGSSGPAPSITEPLPKSAPPNVRGKVTKVGSTGSGLAQIDIGSDSGVTAGNVLTVFKDNVYKGELRITNASAKIAVGIFTPARRTMTIEEGDSVITSFSSIPQ